MLAQDFIDQLQHYASDGDASQLSRFFKTGPGEYGEGDLFIGVRVPDTRRVCRKFKKMPLGEIQKLLASPIHEHRLAALILMSEQYRNGDAAKKEQLYAAYLSALDEKYINNWDLVDTSCEHIVGAHAKTTNNDILFTLARSRTLWHQRVAMISCFAWLRKGEVGPTIEIAEILWREQHDLLQKAVGWMLRELGKRVDEQLLLDFLDTHAHAMPRTQLRYAIERLPTTKRQFYMQRKDAITSNTPLH